MKYEQRLEGLEGFLFTIKLFHCRIRCNLLRKSNNTQYKEKENIYDLLTKRCFKNIFVYFILDAFFFFTVNLHLEKYINQFNE